METTPPTLESTPPATSELTTDQMIAQFRERCRQNIKNYRGVLHQKNALPETVSVVTDRFTYTNLL